MRFEYTSPSRHRVRGKPFKLFSDELPRIDLNRTYLDSFQNESIERDSTGRRYRRRQENDFTNHDRFSLPSIGTPEWDRMSGSDRQRPKSQSSEHMNPNLVRINQRIRRRYGITDRREQFFQQLNKTSAGQENALNNVKQNIEDLKLNEKNTIFVGYGNAESGKDHAESKPKSILQQLLNASAKDAAKVKEMEDGIKHFDQAMVNEQKGKRIKRARSVRKQVEIKESVEENIQIRKLETPDTKLDIPDSVEQAKPGILKRKVGIQRSQSTKLTVNECLIKPRLVHQENIISEKANGSANTGDNVKISVHVDTPLSRLNDLLYIPLPPSTPKDRTKRRVNFVERDIDDETDIPYRHDMVSTENKTKVTLNETPASSENGIQIREDNMDTLKYEGNDVYIQPKEEPFRGEIQRKKRVKRKQRSESFSVKTTTNDKQGKIDVENQDLIDTILLTAQKKEFNKDKYINPVWQAAKTQQSSDAPISKTEPSQSTAVINISPPNEPTRQPSGGKRRSISRSRSMRSHIPTIHIPLDFLEESTTTDSYLGSPGFDTFSELDIDNMFDDFDIDDFAEHIDRRLSGDELIKAYRLWDRKRKEFPTGLKKIEAPLDRDEFNVYPPQYGNVRSYKITG